MIIIVSILFILSIIVYFCSMYDYKLHVKRKAKLLSLEQIDRYIKKYKYDNNGFYEFWLDVRHEKCKEN